jgi:hypothetical protein
MARKELFVTIADEGRDKGKVFKLTEQSAIDIDKWANRATHAIIRAGGVLPDEIVKMGVIGILVVGYHRLMHIPWSELDPLLDELMRCVDIVPTPNQPNVIRKLFPNDIEEVQTLRTLREQVFVLHTGFMKPADVSKSPDVAAGANS